MMANPSWATEADNVAAVCAASGALVRSLLARPREHTEKAAGLVSARLHLGAVLGKVAAAEAQRDHASLEAVRELLARVEAAEAEGVAAP